MDNENEIRVIRHKLGLTQEAFAIKLGLSVMTVKRWEAGKHKPSRMARRLLEEVQK